MNAERFHRRFLYLILLTWIAPPFIGLGFILFIGVLNQEQMEGVLRAPTQPFYIVGWLVFAAWYFPRYIRPVERWIQDQSRESAEGALHCMRCFPLHFWGIFLLYLALAPGSVILSAERYTDYIAHPIDWFRVQLIALIVSIIVGLPIFFRILDLFGRALGDIQLGRPHVTVKVKIFLIGALMPLLIDTMLVQYYWTRTGFFDMETFLVWLTLEALAIAGSLIFVKSIGQSIAPLDRMLAGKALAGRIDTARLQAQSTDELGVLACGYRELLQELAAKTEALSLNNEILHTADRVSGLPQLIDTIVTLTRESIDDDMAFLILLDKESEELVGVAQTGASYEPRGHFRISLKEASLAVWIFQHEATVAVGDVENDERVSPRMRERFQIKSAIGAVLKYERQPLGVLMTLNYSHKKDYTKRELILIEGLANEAALAVTTAKLDAERREAEAALQRSRDELEIKVNERTAALTASNRELESFSYSVSHDLRAPLRAIDGFGQALLDDCGERLDETGRGYLERIRRNAQRMAQLIDDLLDLARIGSIEMNPEDVNLAAMAEEIVHALEEQQPDRQVVFDVQIEGNVRADRQLLHIALQNLLANAWKYTRNRETAQIVLGNRIEDGETAYFVRDNGAGFDMAYVGKLFHPFERLHSNDQFEGTGIGLAIVARIIERHGGRVRAEGEVGRGATFYFTLPRI